MATVYVGSSAAGTGDGSTAGNKMAWTDMDAAIQAAGAGGTVLMVSTDTYSYASSSAITISHGGTAGNPVRITSTNVANPALIRADRTNPWPAWGGPNNLFPPANVGRNILTLATGANYLTFDHINWRDVGICFQPTGTITGLTLADMMCSNIRQFLRVSGVGVSIQSGTFQRIRAFGFPKSLFQFGSGTAGSGSADVVIEDIFGDSQLQDGDPLVTGIQIAGNTEAQANRRFEIRRCTFKNLVTAYDPGNAPTYQQAYYQGDGISTEEHDSDILIDACYVETAGDGGVDLKSKRTVVRHSTFKDCKRSIRKHPSIRPDDVTRYSTELEVYRCSSLYPHKRGGSGTQAHVNSTDMINMTDCVLVDDVDNLTAVFNSETSFGFAGAVHVNGGSITKKTVASLQANDATVNSTAGAGATLDRFVTITNVA